MFLFVIIRIFFYIFVIGGCFLQHESNANVGLTNVQNGEYLPPFVFTCLFVLYI
jgi:preprotein translocase subunit SecG